MKYQLNDTHMKRLEIYYRQRHCTFCILSGHTDGCHPEKHPVSWHQYELESYITPDRDF